MPINSGNDEFVRLYEEKLVAAADRFKPELILISAGFDLKANDNLGSFRVTAEGISRMTKIIMDIANKHCNGKIVSMLEGGYCDRPRDPSIPGLDPTYSGLAQCVESHVKTLLTGEIQNESPFFRNAPIIKSPSVKKNDEIIFDGHNLVCSSETELPLTVHIMDIQGRIIRTFETVNGRSIRVNDLKITPGRYTVSFQIRNKCISKNIILL